MKSCNSEFVIFGSLSISTAIGDLDDNNPDKVALAAASLPSLAAAQNTMSAFLTSRSATAAATVSSLSGQALIDYIYLQTRLELWGEGKSYFAMKRNQATVTRGSNHVFRAGETFVHSQDEMTFQIPQSEINNNPSITDQNQ